MVSARPSCSTSSSTSLPHDAALELDIFEGELGAPKKESLLTESSASGGLSSSSTVVEDPAAFLAASSRLSFSCSKSAFIFDKLNSTSFLTLATQ